ncbi:MAG: chorismate synthase [Legionellaceae bacterium]|nr:chorismate synthase [Legionellaceae bacterium]
MSGNSFGRLFRVTTFGESHGKAMGCIIDGCPPQFPLQESDIQTYLDKRRPGQHIHTSSRKESDAVHILSGVFEGQTLGSPILLMVYNQDMRSDDYEAYRHVFRPGHADYTYQQKYGIRDHRGGGRASARETVARVAAGAVARLYLQKMFGIHIQAYTTQIGSLALEYDDARHALDNIYACPNTNQLSDIQAYMESLQQDSCGAQIKIVASQVPAGWGEPVFDKLNASIAQALMSIPAVKAVEIGDGVNSVFQQGSQHRDALGIEGFHSNHAGGILGGISSGQDLEIKITVKPTSSVPAAIQTIDRQGMPHILQVTGRHDPCVGFRAISVAEAMLALVLIDHSLRQKAIS